MDWQRLMHDWQMIALQRANVGAIALTGVAIVASYAIGWYVGRRFCEPLSAYARRLGGQAARTQPQTLAAILRYGVAAMLLLIAASVAPPGSIILLLFAAALGLASGLLILHAGTLLGLDRIASLVAALIGFAATMAGVLGGTAPLVTGLQSVAFPVGKHQLSLLLLVNAAITIGILVIVARIANRALTQAIGRSHALDPSQRVLVQKLAGIAVIVVAVLLGLDLLSIDLTALTVFSGALGLAIGFGLQKTFGNLISGLILLMDRSIKPGDVIVVGDTFGAVSKIGVRAVSVVTRDGKEHLIPNEKLMTDPVENWSYSTRNVRIHIPVGISYTSDQEIAQRLMIEAAVAAERVLDKPKPTVWLTDFGASAVQYDILAWIADPEMGVGNVRSDILNRLWRSFAENGIELPFAQHDVHIRSMPARFGPSGRAAGDEDPTSS